jgi:hypothetical protein
MHHQNQEKTAMSFRKQCAGLATAAVAASVLAFAGPAHAVTTTHDLDDPSFDISGTTPAVAADLIGVGSDTSQNALHRLGESWNAGGHTFRIGSFAATSAGTIAIPNGDINRPNGSGAGKKMLYTGGAGTNDADVDFARSSSALNTEESNAGLKAIPFALDELTMAVSASTPSNAPAELTAANIVKIYQCDPAADTWAEVGGTSTEAIAPKIPQSGSGTRSFFEAQLKALNANTAVTLGGCVTAVQEHDDTLIKNNANAIAPFSIGRAGLLNGSLRLVGPWSAQRALYNVVRGTSSDAGIGADDASIQAVFGENGFLCSNDARDEIEAAGFKQLARTSDLGACGTLVSSTSNFKLNEQVISSTGIAASFPSAGSAQLTATITPSSAAGSVEFFEGANSVGQALVSAGTATFTATGLTAGEHQFTAKFTPDSTTVAASEAVTSGVVTAASSTTVAFTPATSSYGKSRVINATVLTGDVAATGTVAIKVGTAAAVNVELVNGIASYAVGTTKAAGTYAVTASYLGNSSTATSAASKSLAITKAAATVTETFPVATLAGKPGKGVVKVAIAGSTVKPTGTVRIYQGTKLLKSATLVNGQVTITLPKLTRGKKLLTVKYLGSANVNAKSLNFYLTQR